jgi:hypothetical protein
MIPSFPDTTAPPLGNWPSFPKQHNTAAQLLPGASLAWEIHLINRPLCLQTKFSLHLPGHRRMNLPGRPLALIHELLQGRHVLFRMATCHRIDGSAFSIHQEAADVFFNMLPRSLRPMERITSDRKARTFKRNCSIYQDFMAPKNILRQNRMSARA